MLHNFAVFLVNLLMFQFSVVSTFAVRASFRSMRPLSRRFTNFQVTQPFESNTFNSIQARVLKTDNLESSEVLVFPIDIQSNKDNSLNITESISAFSSILPDSLKDRIGSITSHSDFKIEASKQITLKLFGSFGSFKGISFVGIPSNLSSDERSFKLGSQIAAAAKECNASSIGIVSANPFSEQECSQILVGAYDAVYQDSRYKKQDPSSTLQTALSSIAFSSITPEMDVANLNKRSEAISWGVNFAKDLVNSPPNSKHPVAISALAKSLGTSPHMSCNVLGYEECKKLGMEGYLGVQQGSSYPPQFIHLHYKHCDDSSEAPRRVTLIGKGLTFDSGGYNLKSGPSAMIELMKFDMGGCAAVMGCAKAISLLQPKNIEIDFISAVCENMVDSHAVHPGDILKISNGKTVEVINTDAEGRLTLADALVYASKLQDPKPNVIIDLATLTGACIVGLGESMAGLYSSHPSLMTSLQQASQRSQDKVWPMPLPTEYQDLIKSKIADLKNVGGAYGGSITAALFLKEFVDLTNDQIQWAHIDMAGPVWNTKESKATGFGVKLLVDYLLSLGK